MITVKIGNSATATPGGLRRRRRRPRRQAYRPLVLGGRACTGRRIRDARGECVAGDFSRGTGPSDPLANIIGDRCAIRAHAAEYDRLADFLHDETLACSRCERRWYQPSQGRFDADIAAEEGDLVCEDCASEHLIEAADLRGWGTDAAAGEHGTLRARFGEVVG